MADTKTTTQAPQATAPVKRAAAYSLPIIYRLFFLIIEPIFALIGAYYAHFRQDDYLSLTHAVSAPFPIPLGTSIALSQLANLYVFFAINEALVLRSTSDVRVWKTVLFGLLVADVGHLYTVRELGPDVYWSFLKWNAMAYGNIPFVYLGAAMRLAFLANIGLGRGRAVTKKTQ
ncbi:hypothetical protein GE09DRAFT_1054884 [Coniochaeta sp. 2T2.1]|nr:hypothetical protein GE09DRAFT_1054884 [Coniochaeta sp. 2T2.1]